MPQLASPDMPPWAERAYAALGNRPGLAALAVLASQREPIPSWAIAAAAGLKDGATSLALTRLEEAGLVIGSVPPPRPRGTRVTWTVDRAALSALVRELDAGLETQVAMKPATVTSDASKPATTAPSHESARRAL